MEKEEEIISFKIESDRTTYGVLGYEGEELMAAISGYDLSIVFNMRLINSLADAESCANGLADVFYQVLMEQLIARNSNFLQPVETKSSILE